MKATRTVMFFKEAAQKEINLDSVELMITEQFYFYRQILEKGYSKERAISCMEAVETFFVAGWRDLFERMM